MTKGLVHIYCGEGKGKTTAAAGLCLRAAGQGFRVLIAQFFKDGDSGEITALVKAGLAGYVHGFAPGPDFVKSLAAGLPPRVEAVRGLFEAACRRAVEERCDVLLLDELTWGVFYGVVEEAAVLQFLENRPEGLEVIITGRAPGASLLARADYVSRIECEKHPYARGIPARRGIEY